MLQIILFVIEGVAILGGVILFAIAIRRRLSTRWSTWLWGGAAFVLSQLVRLPLLLGLTALLPILGFKPDRDTAFWFNLVILSLTAGLFEETSRYVILRWPARASRGWPAAVMFGAGHGGIEALLLIMPAIINNIVLLTAGDSIIAQTRAISPLQADQVAAAVNALRTMEWWQPAVAVIERVMAITFHIAASVLIMQMFLGLTTRPVIWWATAVGLHALLDGIAILGNHYMGILGAELGTALFTIVSLYIIFRYRKSQAVPAQALQSQQ